MEFLTFQDNTNAYYWTLIDGDGATLARAVGFPSRDAAEQAAQHVKDRAGTARLDRGSSDEGGNHTSARAAK